MNASTNAEVSARTCTQQEGGWESGGEAMSGGYKPADSGRQGWRRRWGGRVVPLQPRHVGGQHRQLVRKLWLALGAGDRRAGLAEPVREAGVVAHKRFCWCLVSASASAFCGRPLPSPPSCRSHEHRSGLNYFRGNVPWGVAAGACTAPLQKKKTEEDGSVPNLSFCENLGFAVQGPSQPECSLWHQNVSERGAGACI